MFSETRSLDFCLPFSSSSWSWLDTAISHQLWAELTYQHLPINQKKKKGRKKYIYNYEQMLDCDTELFI